MAAGERVACMGDLPPPIQTLAKQSLFPLVPLASHVSCDFTSQGAVPTNRCEGESRPCVGKECSLSHLTQKRVRPSRRKRERKKRHSESLRIPPDTGSGSVCDIDVQVSEESHD